MDGKKERMIIFFNYIKIIKPKIILESLVY